jgi:hypothetical protein
VTSLPTSRARKVRRNFTPTEHDEQVALMQWAEYALAAHPELELLFAVPNGGARHKVTAAKLKAEGVKAGVQDIVLPVPRGTFHGLFLEMKRRQGGALSTEQKWWRDKLYAQGYQTCVCKGWESARDAIVEYLALPSRRVAA